MILAMVAEARADDVSVLATCHRAAVQGENEAALCGSVLLMWNELRIPLPAGGLARVQTDARGLFVKAFGAPLPDRTVVIDGTPTTVVAHQARPGTNGLPGGGPQEALTWVRPVDANHVDTPHCIGPVEGLDEVCGVLFSAYDDGRLPRLLDAATGGMADVFGNPVPYPPGCAQVPPRDPTMTGEVDCGEDMVLWGDLAELDGMRVAADGALLLIEDRVRRASGTVGVGERTPCRVLGEPALCQRFTVINAAVSLRIEAAVTTGSPMRVVRCIGPRLQRAGVCAAMLSEL